MPLLSIITPVYRTGDLLRRCLQSICEITLQDWECIVVNDGTDDGSFEIAKEFAEKDNRFVLIDNTENHGVSYARNKALDIAKGTWVTFLDSDDFTHPNDYERMITLAEQNDVSFVYRDKFESKYEGVYDLEKVPTLFGWPPHLYKNSVIQEHNLRMPLGITFNEDCLFNFWMYAYCEKVYYANIKFERSHNEHWRVPRRKWNSQQGNAEQYLKFCEEFSDKKYEKLRKRMLWYLGACFHHTWDFLTASHKINPKVYDMQFMALGSNCVSIAALGDLRVRGPVDNFYADENQIPFRPLFNGTLIKQVLYRPPLNVTVRGKNFEGDSNIDVMYEDFHIIHNNPFEQKFRDELTKRIKNFEDFKRDIQNPNKYFVICLGKNEINAKTHTANESIIKQEIRILKQHNVLNKTIFVGSRNVLECPWFDFNDPDFQSKFDIPLYVCLDEVDPGNLERKAHAHADFLEKVSSLLFN